MSWTQHIKHPSKLLTVGEIVETKILSIDQEDKKISLGLKQLEPDPWDTLEDKYPINSRHQGKVRNLTNFGAFVELEEGIDGLIHISDLSWTKKIRHPGEVVKKGDDIEVVVLNVDRENRRISLGYKQIAENPWNTFEETYRPGTVIKGKIVRLIEKGVIAELPEGVDGFVPMSHLSKPNLTKPSDGYKVGDDLDLCVIEFNKSVKKIVLSEKIDYARSLIDGKDVKDKNAVIAEVEDLFGDEAAKTFEGIEPAAAETPAAEQPAEAPETVIATETSDVAAESSSDGPAATEEVTEKPKKKTTGKKTTRKKDDEPEATKEEEKSEE